MLSVDSHHSPWLRSSVLQEVYQAHAGSSPALPRGRLAARTCEACLGVLRPHLPSQPLAAFVLLPAAAAGVRTTSLGAHTDVCGLYSSTVLPKPFSCCTCHLVTPMSLCLCPGSHHLAAYVPSFLAVLANLSRVFLSSLCVYPSDFHVPVELMHRTCPSGPGHLLSPHFLPSPSGSPSPATVPS